MLGPAGEDMDDTFHLALAPHQGTESVVFCFAYQVAKRTAHGQPFGTLGEQGLGRSLDCLLPQPEGTESIVAQDRRGKSALVAGNPEKQVFRADVALFQPVRLIGRSLEVEVFVFPSKALRTRA